MAQPAVNDVLTWDGSKGVYSPNPALSLALTDTYIFVGNSIGVATGVPLTLNDEPGPFALGNTGILTMPDASVLGRGLLNAADWTTVGFLHNDGAGNLQWQAVGGSQDLASTLAIGNATGGLAITSDDTGTELRVFDGNKGYFVNTIGAVGITDEAFVNPNQILLQTARAFVSHDTLVELSSPAFQWTADSGGYAQGWLYGDTGTILVGFGSNQLEIDASAAELLHTTFVSVHAATTALIYNSIGAFIASDAPVAATKYIQIQTGSLDVRHSTLVDIQSPTVQMRVTNSFTEAFYYGSATLAKFGFNTNWVNADTTAFAMHGNIQLYDQTASTVPYLDASKYLVSSAITPTELGYLTGATSPLQAQIDALVSGLSWKQAVRVRTTADITLSGTQTIDGVAVIVGDRVLVMNQTTTTENGIYICAAGAWARSADANTGAELLQATVATQEGTLYADKQYVNTADAPIVIGTTPIVFILVGGTTYVGTTNRITVTGNVIDIAATYVGQTSITTLGTVTTGTWNATAISDTYISTSYIKADGTRALTGDWAAGAFIISAKSMAVTGTAGAGFYEFIAQSSNAAAPSVTGFRLFGGSTGAFGWARKNGSDTFVRVIDGTLTGDRTYTLQDASSTLAMYSNKLSVFAATTSAELAGVISDETGFASGALLVFSKSPTIDAPTVTGITTFSGAINEVQGANIASAGTTDIGAATGNYVNITGTTTITGLGTIQAGTRRILNFNGALILTYNATSLILPGGINITTAAGDVGEFISLGSGNWICTKFQRATGEGVSRLIHMGVYESFVITSPADSTTVYVGVPTTLAPNAAATGRQFQLPTGVIRRASFFVDPTSGLGSNEAVTINLRNVTDSTSTLLGTLTFDVRGNTTFSGALSIVTDSSKYYSIEYVYPAWATNPTGLELATNVEVFDR